MNRKIGGTVLVVLAALAAGWYWWFLGGARNQTDRLRLMGHVEATETDLAFKVPGIISRINFQEGDEVKAGEVVAELDARDLRDELAAAQARLKAAEAALARLLAGSRPQEIAEARAAVQQAQADLENKRLDYERMEGLLARQAVPQSRRDNARAAYLVAQETWRRAREQLSLVLEGPRREDIDRARAELKQAQANLELAKTRLDYATLRAPVNGVVLTRPAEPGEVAAVGATILTTADLDNVYVEVYLPQTELGRVRLGQPAQVTIDAYPGRPFAGRVSFINAKAEFTPKTVETYKERVALVYRTKIQVENPRHELKPGMPAEVVIQLMDAAGREHHSR